jgi:UDP-N-acetylmuramoyl-tripeptide--D-alanyl-D-alanine ligase
MKPLWRLEDFVAGAGGSLGGNTRDVTGISIDTRTLEPGDAYFAITGNVHDGHKFVAQALEKGAALAVVRHDYEGGGALLRVEEPLEALEGLALAARARSAARIAAVTGSVGKTGAKEALRLALGAGARVHVSEKSYNNQWGVPLCVARLPEDAEFAVFEIGMNHPGEITPLVGLVRPHVALITTVEPVHIGYFESLEAIAAAKAEILDGLEPGGVAVLNRDNGFFAFLEKRAKAAGAGRVLGFGAHEEADVRLKDAALHERDSCVAARICDHDAIYKMGAPGRHMVLNSLGILAVVEALGADLALAALALADVRAPQGRGARSRLKVPGGEIVLIDESYNANPASMRAALSLLATTKTGKGGRRIAVLGDMLELGDHAPDLHAALALEVVAAQVDLVFASGANMKKLWENIPPVMRGAYSETAGGLETRLLEEIRGGDVVMIKGSLASCMGPLAETLKNRYPEAGTGTARMRQGD